MDPSQDLLFDVIQSSDIDRLRTTLREICTAVPDAFSLACNKLLVQKGELKKAIDLDVHKETVVLARHEGEEGQADLSPEVTSESDYSDVSEEEHQEQRAGQKRKRAYTRQRHDMCKQCEKEYDVLNNERGCCSWHEGEVELDHESSEWYDWDEGAHGECDTAETREQFPDGFVWTCCGRKSAQEGCRKSVHRPDRAKRVRKGIAAHGIRLPHGSDVWLNE
ncbi:hypothetical protein BDV95DRAFT_345113 [Massariosphaeria phaeospora]|uniref:C2H2-type domain-containing protein n=1 Tax=Massariosphaeria phaeospora TaxID=100035 RepID=A0A7C8IGA8_9PLEO|nr:hypothetical protein BDV95DRAFT_345113 [Massariosphaeria phaeospora]